MQKTLQTRIFNEYVGERQNADCFEIAGKALSFFAHTAYGKTVHLKERSSVDFKSANCALRILSAIVAIALMPIIFVGLLLTYLSLSQRNAHELTLKHFSKISDQLADQKKVAIQTKKINQNTTLSNDLVRPQPIPTKIEAEPLLKNIGETKTDEIAKAIDFPIEPIIEEKKEVLPQVDAHREHPQLPFEPILKEEILDLDPKKDENDPWRQVGERLAIGLKSFLDKRKAKLAALKLNGLLLKDEKDLQQDKEAVLIAVKQNGLSLQFASEECKKDIKIVFYAVRNNGRALEFAHETLRDNPGIVATAIRNNRIAYIHASRRLKFDKIILDMLRLAPFEPDAPIEIKEILPVYVDIKKENPIINKFAINNFEEIDDHDMHKDQIKKIFIPEVKDNLIDKKTIIDKKYFIQERIGHIQKIEIPHPILQDFQKPLIHGINQPQDLFEITKNNKILALLLIKNNPFFLLQLTENQRDDEELVLAAVQLNGLALQFASVRLKDNENIVKAAMDQNADALKFASDNLKQKFDVDPDIY